MKPPGQVLILNVDDNDGARYAKSRILARAGFHTLEASTGYEALDKVASEAPDLVLLDVKLPDISGLEVCRRIKSDPAMRTTLVLQTSAAAVHSIDKVRALEGGADSYLTEPIEPAELIANVRALLRLRRAEEALREADRRKDQFLAMLAHELRNPLAPIRNAVDIMQPDRLHTKEAIDEARQIISRQVTHLARLVDDLLDVSRITQGKITLRQAPVDVQAAISAAIETAQPNIDAKRHTLVAHVPEETVYVRGDAVRIAQVLGNVLSNASKYTPEEGRIWLDAQTRDSELVVTVRDNGVGIAPEMLPHIFELFVQSESSLERSEGGLGIGLPLVRTLVTLHGGSVEAFSSGLGYGSEFVVRLPLLPVAEHPSALVPAAARAPCEGAACRILLVDDSIDATAAMSMLLQSLGHEVRVTHDGNAALQAAAEFSPQVVILDIGLPGKDGFAVAREMRQHPVGAQALLIALTGYGQPADKLRSREAGFDIHFVKPVSFNDIEAVLKQLPTRNPSTGERPA